MSELVLMPTPNWFTSRPIDVCKHDGSMAFCTINSIILTKNVLNEYVSTIRDAHSKRLHAVAFHVTKMDTQDVKLLASCSDDLDVKVWQLSCNNKLFNQHKFHQNIPTCLDWLEFDEDETQKQLILVSCDIKGNIFKWNLITNEHARYFPENKAITQLKSCPNTFKIAVGYKHGTIVVLDISNEHMKILHKLKDHEDSINCLSWYSFANDEKYFEETRKIQNRFEVEDVGSLLFSSSEDKTIRLWCTNKGRCLKAFKAPSSASNRSTKQRQQQQQQQQHQINYTAFCWPQPQFVISGSFKGELCYLDLFEQSDREIIQEHAVNNPKWNHFAPLSVEKGHRKIVFDIKSFKDQIITLSIDRLINTWNMKSLKQESSMNTLNGFVYSISYSPIDSDIMAISIGDGSIKLYNQNQADRTVKSFNNNIKSEVTQVAWHPIKESIIAFGTKDGKVGIADIFHINKPAQFIYTNYKQSVYTLVWCEPILSEYQSAKQSSSFCLYSVSDGKIMQHNIQFANTSNQIINPNSQTVNFYKELTCNSTEDENETNKDFCTKPAPEHGLTEFCVLKFDKHKSDVYFAIGKFDGSIEIFAKNESQTSKLCTLYNHQKLVTCLKWNQPRFNVEHSNLLLASGSNDSNVIIVDFKLLIDELQQSELSKHKEKSLFAKFKHKLVGHKERITSLSWSLDSKLLASSSYDATVQIWNAIDGTPVANYRGHSEKLLCCLFSLNDANVVFSGGEDYCLQKWRIDAQVHKTPPEESVLASAIKKTKYNKKQQKKMDEEQLEKKKVESLESLNEIQMEIETEQIEIGKTSNNELVQVEERSRKVLKLTDVSTNQTNQQSQRETKSLFLLSSHGSKSQKIKLQECLVLYKALYETHQVIVTKMRASLDKLDPLELDFELCQFEFNPSQLNLCIFGNRLSTLHMLRLEQAELKRLNVDKWWYFEIWRGNIAKLVSESEANNNLNDLLVNLYQIALNANINEANSSSASVLNNYINQLTKGKTDQINKAVLYSIALYDVHKAINIYLSHNMFQYALCLAHLRLAPKDPFLYEILKKYASYATFIGDYETAAMCYIRMAEFESASKVLIRRNVKNDSECEALIKELLKKIS